MSFDSFISLLTESNWFFMDGLIVLLGTASALCFSEKFSKISAKDRRAGNPKLHR